MASGLHDHVVHDVAQVAVDDARPGTEGRRAGITLSNARSAASADTKIAKLAISGVGVCCASKRSFGPSGRWLGVVLVVSSRLRECRWSGTGWTGHGGVSCGW